MAFTYNGITFNPADEVNGVKYKIQNTSNKLSKVTDQSQIRPFVNAVEIDWNGAIIGES